MLSNINLNMLLVGFAKGHFCSPSHRPNTAKKICSDRGYIFVFVPPDGVIYKRRSGPIVQYDYQLLAAIARVRILVRMRFMAFSSFEISWTKI